MPTFVDRVILHASAGNGGHGCASIHREKYKPLGGPDGGNGGRGGNVALIVDPDTTTLLAFHHAPHRRATSGKPGQGSNRDGANGEDMILPVPDGTVVKTEDGVVLADLVGAGSTYIVAQGGRGGLGNAALASPRRKAPGFALLGEPGAVQDVVLELKTVADVALVGFPNAGKSSLVAAMSAARPKIADYPFTTLVPNLGVVQAGESRFTVADVPGLVRGASEGQAAWVLSSFGTSSAALRWCTSRLRDDGTRPRSGQRPRGNRSRTGRLRRAVSAASVRAAAAGGAEQGRRARRVAIWPRWFAARSKSAASRSSSSRRRPEKVCASSSFAMADLSSGPGGAAARMRRHASCSRRAPSTTAALQ